MKRYTVIIALLVAYYQNAQCQPNVIVIIADDIGLGDISYYNENSKLNTEAIDKLAKEGVAFTNTHSAASVCAPSRYSILSGNYPWRGKRDNGVWDATGGSQFKYKQETLGHLFKRSNYKTAFFGKWNLGGAFKSNMSNGLASSIQEADFNTPFLYGPVDLGFDRAFFLAEGIQKPPYAFIDQNMVVNPQNMADQIGFDTDGLKLSFPGPGQQNWSTKEAPKLVLESLISFVQTNQNVPFFIAYSMLESHWPWNPLDSLGQTRVKGTSKISKRSDCILQVDATIKYLKQVLENLNLYSNTIIVFTSDNGANTYDKEVNAEHWSNYPWFGIKGEIYEGGHRVPFIVGGGSSLIENIKSLDTDKLIGHTDLYSTLSNWVDLKNTSTLSGVDSRDAFSLTENRSFLLYQANLVGSDTSKYAIRHQDYVLTFNSEHTPVALFDLNYSLDQNEPNNLISKPQFDSIVSLLNNKYLDIKYGEANSNLRNKNLRQDISIYPNPTSDYLNIGWDNFSIAVIYDLSGKQLFESNKPTLDLKTLGPGVYMLRVKGANGDQISFRVVKE